jgi:hypothetical protein
VRLVALLFLIAACDDDVCPLTIPDGATCPGSLASCSKTPGCQRRGFVCPTPTSCPEGDNGGCFIVNAPASSCGPACSSLDIATCETRDDCDVLRGFLDEPTTRCASGQH